MATFPMVYRAPGGGGTSPQLHPDVRAEMGRRWVCFQPNVEQPGFLIRGVFKGPAGSYGYFEAFLPTMGVFSIIPDPTLMGAFSGSCAPDITVGCRVSIMGVTSDI